MKRVPGGSTAVEKGDWAQALQSLKHLLTLSDVGLEQLYDAYLGAAREVFGLKIGVIGTLDAGVYTFAKIQAEAQFPYREGDTRPIANLFAAEAMNTQASLFCHDIGRDPQLSAHPLYHEGHFETYAAAPIRVAGTTFGVISLLDPDPRPEPFTSQGRIYLELLADMLGQAIGRRELEARRLSAEQKSRDANVLFGTAFANAPIGMSLVGLDGRFLKVNAAAGRLFGFTEADLLKRDFQSITYPPDLDADLDQMQALLAGDTTDYEMEKRYVRPNGEIVWAQLDVALARHDDGTPRCFVSQIQDINPRRALMSELDLRRRELEDANRKLIQLAALDPLTGMLNRRALRQRLDEEMANAVKAGTPLAFVMVDVDHFKDYNDRHGHLQGDVALKQVAHCLKGAARGGDTVGRFGGEEFMLLLPQTGEKDAFSVAERVRTRVATSKDLRWPLTVSAGVHVFQPEGVAIPVDRPIAQADVALYKAKQLGRNRVEVV